MSNEDYVFQYKLDHRGNEESHYAQDRLLEVIREEMKNILDIVLPTHGDQEVKVDGFKLLKDRNKIHKIFSQDIEEKSEDESYPFQRMKNASLYEPRILFIKKELENLLSVIDLEKGGKTVNIDGFQLKNLSDWLVPSSGDPSEVFNYAGSRCNLSCVFCCNRGNPSSLALVNSQRGTKEEFDEINTRIRYFSPSSRRSLFFSAGSIYEVLNHPNILEILLMIRDKTKNPIRITTNGANLTERMVRELERLKPIYLYLSLNSASLQRRNRFMGDNNPEVAINSLSLLRERGIPYAVVIVAWPDSSLEEMLLDVEATIRYASHEEAHLIQINLPGYSKYFSPEKLFDLDKVWSSTVSLVRKMRKEVSSPIVAMPTLYEENLFELEKNLPRVIGLVKNSPAFFSGIRQGDTISKINSISIYSRPQARDLLSLLRESKEIFINVIRNKKIIDLKINPEHFDYPYSKEIDNHLGVIFMGTGFRISYLGIMRGIINRYGAKHVLFLSSTLVKPVFEQCLVESHLFGDVKIDIQVPQNRFFGGNICMGDLLVVQDFIDFIKVYTGKSKVKPDLIVIPSSPFSLGGWKRDLTGRVYLDVEREVGIPVELLECTPILD